MSPYLLVSPEFLVILLLSVLEKPRPLWCAQIFHSYEMTGTDTWASLCPFHSPFLFVLNIPPWRLRSPVSAHPLCQWLQLWEGYHPAMNILITVADIRGDLILLLGPSPCFSSSSPICVLSCLSSHFPRPLLHPSSWHLQSSFLLCLFFFLLLCLSVKLNTK